MTNYIQLIRQDQGQLVKILFFARAQLGQIDPEVLKVLDLAEVNRQRQIFPSPDIPISQIQSPPSPCLETTELLLPITSPEIKEVLAEFLQPAEASGVVEATESEEEEAFSLFKPLVISTSSSSCSTPTSPNIRRLPPTVPTVNIPVIISEPAVASTSKESIETKVKAGKKKRDQKKKKLTLRQQKELELEVGYQTYITTIELKKKAKKLSQKLKKDQNRKEKLAQKFKAGAETPGSFSHRKIAQAKAAETPFYKIPHLKPTDNRRTEERPALSLLNCQIDLPPHTPQPAPVPPPPGHNLTKRQRWWKNKRTHDLELKADRQKKQNKNH